MKLGSKHSPETLLKLRDSHLGKVLSPEQRAKISASGKGRVLSPETKLKMSLARKRVLQDPKIRAAISAVHKGKFVSEETRKRLSFNRLGSKLTTEHKAKISAAGKGKRRGFETRLKLSLSKRGDKNPNWANCPPDLKGQIRKSFYHRQWRSDVFTRDNFTCTICGKQGGELHADHIKAFWRIILENKIKTYEQAVACSELWNINNGRTLCEPCHLKTENFGFKGCNKKVRAPLILAYEN